MTSRLHIALGLAALILSAPRLHADDAPKSGPDLTDYKTVESAVTTSIRSTSTQTKEPQSAYLGILLDSAPREGAVVAEVDPDSPAAKAGIRSGDILTKLDDRDIKDDRDALEILAGKSAEQELQISLKRNDQSMTLKAILTAWSRPRSAQDRSRPGLGVQVAEGNAGEGVLIERVAPGSAADRAKLKVGEVLLKLDGIPITDPDQLGDLLAAKPPESTIVTTLLLAEKAVDLKIKLDAAPEPAGPLAGIQRRPGGARGGGIGGGYWTKPSFRLAIICVEYPDVKHNEKITREAWEQALFSEGTYNKTNATGQPVQGSFRDYFLEQSYGYFKVEGQVFDWIEVGKKRPEYATGNRMAMLTESMDKLLERDGKEALKDFDGVFFIYAGGRYPAPRGSLYWPHRSSMSHKGKRWPYFIIEEGGTRMQGLSVLCHEFGHMLGLPDLYARPENPGMEGLGIWCCMSQQPNRSVPQHFSAWAKEKVGWLKPAIIDPTVKQKLILAPIEDSAKECFKVLVRDDGSEYYLLENRKKTKFDKSLPAEGLLIWHVLANRPALIESHGIAGAAGPRVYMSDVPYPSGANDAYTPYTTPSSRSPLGGGKPVHVTNIRRLSDARVSFLIGYEYE